jgi:hypothetical protein
MIYSQILILLVNQKLTFFNTPVTNSSHKIVPEMQTINLLQWKVKLQNVLSSSPLLLPWRIKK